MNLYHFTSLAHLVGIIADGMLSKGEIPVSPTKVDNGVWATTQAEPAPQAWSQGSVVDKTEVRIKILHPDKFVQWPLLARKLKVQKNWYEALDNAGAGASKHWWIQILPVQLETCSIEVRQGSQYVPVSEEEGARLALPAQAELMTRLRDYAPVDASAAHWFFGGIAADPVAAWLANSARARALLVQRYPSLIE